MKNTQFLVLIIAVILISIGITAFFFGNIKVFDVLYYDANVTVTENTVGISIGNPPLDFGKVPRTGSSSKGVNITNNNDFSLDVRIEPSGKTAEWLSYPKDFAIEPHENKILNFDILIPNSTDPGFYSGKVKITLLKK